MYFRIASLRYSYTTFWPGIPTLSAILLAPITRSASWTALFPWIVSVSSEPIPIPSTVTFGFATIWKRFCKKRLHSRTVSPCSFMGRPMITGTAWQFKAASIFSWKPPAIPVSFVTRKSHWNCLSIASFISLEKGPCIPIRCFPSNPISLHALITEGRESTRAYTRSL